MLLLSPGNINDIAFASTLIAAAGPIKRLIADKTYDANSLRQLFSERSAKAVIPSIMSRRQPIPYSKTIYRQFNLIERMFARLKNFRRSQCATTISPETSWRAHRSLQPSFGGPIDSGP